MSTERLPGKGRYSRAKQKRFQETAVFVHHYGGHAASVKPHQDFLNDLGMDSVAFTLSNGHRLGLLNKIDKPVLKDAHLLLRKRWINEITDVLNAVPGPKIVYSFSFPSAPALISMSARKDVRAWICDGGPFLMLLTCLWNYFTHIEPTPIWLRPTRVSLSAASLEVWDLAEDLHSALNKLPQNFPVLSIRAWQDQLVPIEAIDKVFSGNNSGLHLETLTLPEAGHIDGLQRFPEEYKPRVAKFLNQYATTLNASHEIPAH
ncbi:MAG: hypothetical protein AB7N80_03825 [Bdellovibrionales bacterium]